MTGFYPICQVAELAARYRYTTRALSKAWWRSWQRWSGSSVISWSTSPPPVKLPCGGSAARLTVVLAGASPVGAIPHLAP